MQYAHTHTYLGWIMAGQSTPPGHVPPLRNTAFYSRALLRETNGFLIRPDHKAATAQLPGCIPSHDCQRPFTSCQGWWKADDFFQGKINEVMGFARHFVGGPSDVRFLATYHLDIWERREALLEFGNWCVWGAKYTEWGMMRCLTSCFLVLN